MQTRIFQHSCFTFFFIPHMIISMHKNLSGFCSSVKLNAIFTVRQVPKTFAVGTNNLKNMLPVKEIESRATKDFREGSLNN